MPRTKRTKALPTGRKAWGKNVVHTELGKILKLARTQKQLQQHVVAKALSKAAGGNSNNVRVSSMELGKAIPSDAELTVLASLYQLSVASLRTKRDAAKVDREERLRKSRIKGAKTRRAAMSAKTEAPKPPSNGHAIVRVARVSSLVSPAPAQAPVLADLIDLIDNVAPMPVDREARRRWLACVVELEKIGAGQ